MAISVNWATRVINVPKADMTLIQASPEIRELDINTFRLALKDLEDDPAGIPFQDTHRHNTTVTIAGVVLARVFEIINGYTVTFEDGQYAVNLVGANSNISEVANVNQVSIRSANSAGLTDPGLATDEVVENGLSLAQMIRMLYSVILGKLSGAGTGMFILSFRDIADTKDRLVIQTDASGNRISIISTDPD